MGRMQRAEQLDVYRNLLTQGVSSVKLHRSLTYPVLHCKQPIYAFRWSHIPPRFRGFCYSAGSHQNF